MMDKSMLVIDCSQSPKGGYHATVHTPTPLADGTELVVLAEAGGKVDPEAINWPTNRYLYKHMLAFFGIPAACDIADALKAIGEKRRLLAASAAVPAPEKTAS
jgi:hypothetical protein